MTRVIPRSELPEPEARPTALEPGMKLGRYELLCPIASGGMAQVWAAEQTGDLGFRKLIALKAIRPDFAHDASFRAMFLDEAQLASRIRHVNVVEVLDLGAEGDVVYQAMALVEGTTLSEWGRLVRLPVGVATRIAIDMLRGLHAAHELKDDDGIALGLVHRDVSPQNVLVGTDGVAKLADFGIAKAFGRATEETFVGDVKGKVAYVAPEQLRGYPAAPQSDLFSAGVVFWELLTGDRLFRMPAAASSSARDGMKTRDPRTVAPEVPESVANIVMHALRDNPFDRYPTTLEMADALEDAIRREGLDATHRDVASRLEVDLGERIAERREELRVAKKRAGFIPTPTNPPRRDSIKTHIVPPAPALGVRRPRRVEDAQTEAIPFEPLVLTQVIDPVALRMAAAQLVPHPMDAMTDSVAVAEQPLLYAAQEPPPRKSSGHALPLALAGLMLVLLVVVAGTMRREPAPTPAPAAAAPFPPAPTLPSTPVEAPPPLPAVMVAPTVAPAPAPPPAASSAPAIHRPILSHGRTRPATKPAPPPAPGAATPATPAPRFENPY